MEKTKKRKIFVITTIITLILCLVFYFLFFSAKAPKQTRKAFTSLFGTSSIKKPASPQDVGGGGNINGNTNGNSTGLDVNGNTDGSGNGTGDGNNNGNGSGANGGAGDTNGNGDGSRGGGFFNNLLNFLFGNNKSSNGDDSSPVFNPFSTPTNTPDTPMCMDSDNKIKPCNQINHETGNNSPSVTLSATPSSLPKTGGTAVFKFVASNVKSCIGSWKPLATIQNINKEKDWSLDSDPVNIKNTTTFVITCTDGFSTVDTTTTVLVGDDGNGGYTGPGDGGTGGGPDNGDKNKISAILDANPDSFQKGGGDTTLSWSSTNATSCTPDWKNTNIDTSGNETFHITATKKFSITCSNNIIAGVQDYKVSTTVVVATWKDKVTQCNDEIDNDHDGLIDDKDPACHSDGDVNNTNSYTEGWDNEEIGEKDFTPNVTLSATPSSLPKTGGTAVFKFVASNVKSCIGSWNPNVRLQNTNIEKEWPITSSPQNISATRTFIVVCTNGVINTSATATVGVGGDGSGGAGGTGSNIPNVTLVANPEFVQNAGDSTTLNWESDGVRCTPNWTTSNNLPTGSENVVVNRPKTFSITCFDKALNDPVAAKKNTVSVDVIIPGWTNNVTQCSDGIDNDGDGLIDNKDPACHTDSIVILNDPDITYNPVLNTESKMATTVERVSVPECSDNNDNDGDGLQDKGDPACHDDGDVSNDASYQSTWNDESLGKTTDQCKDVPPLVFSTAEQAELDRITRQFYRISPKLHTQGDINTEVDTARTYDDIVKNISNKDPSKGPLGLAIQCENNTGDNIPEIPSNYTGIKARISNPFWAGEQVKYREIRPEDFIKPTTNEDIEQENIYKNLFNKGTYINDEMLQYFVKYKNDDISFWTNLQDYLSKAKDPRYKSFSEKTSTGKSQAEIIANINYYNASSPSPSFSLFKLMSGGILSNNKKLLNFERIFDIW
ncbi:MAG: hypothetical protein NTX85_00645 [Candidatus Nomurabacteria bacterium]|nr:hypothetical protein [Candidatus Nomurabacteria bacterium]